MVAYAKKMLLKKHAFFEGLRAIFGNHLRAGTGSYYIKPAADPDKNLLFVTGLASVGQD
jgi:hypothetical protein